MVKLPTRVPKASHQVIKHSFDDEAKQYFAPCAHHRQLLIGCGLAGHHATISCHVGVTDNGRVTVAKQLVQLSRRCANKVVDSFLSGTQ